MEEIVIKSPAKINLFLRVLKKRPDGYHDLSTLFIMLALHDTLTIKRCDGSIIKLSSNNKNIPLDNTNLVYKAAEAFRNHTGIKDGIDIDINKNIPVSAGLGGGSSNAAATLTGLNRCFDTKLGDGILHSLGSRLGADVPFFLSFPAAYGQGKGDILTRVDIKKNIPIVLVNPNIAVSTKWAYSNLKLTTPSDISNIEYYYLNFKGGEILPSGWGVNDFETAVIPKYPVISEIKKRLASLGAEISLMSGSGSTVFGLFKGHDEALSAYTEIKKRKDWAVFLTKNLTTL